MVSQVCLIAASSPRSLDTQPLGGEWKFLPADGAFWPLRAFSCVPHPGDPGSNHQGFWVQFRGYSLEKQSSRNQKAKTEREKVQELGEVWRSPAGLEGACVFSEGSLEKAGQSRQSGAGRQGEGEPLLALSCGQQHGARGQGVTCLVWSILREPLGNCKLACHFRDKHGLLPLRAIRVRGHSLGTLWRSSCTGSVIRQRERNSQMGQA